MANRNPSQKSLQRWDTEGGAPKGGRKRHAPAQLANIVDVATGEVEDRPPAPEEQGDDAAALRCG